MKTKLFLVGLILLGSCISNDRPLTNSEKEKIVDETRVLIGGIFQAAENADIEPFKSIFLQSPDFTAFGEGAVTNYEQTISSWGKMIAAVDHQQATMQFEKYTVLNPEMVLYTAVGDWEITMKSDTVIHYEDVGIQFLLKKVDDQWKVMIWNEYYQPMNTD